MWHWAAKYSSTLFLAAALTGVVLYSVIANNSRNFKPGDLGLGIATTSRIEIWQGDTISAIEDDLVPIFPGLEPPPTLQNKVVLIIGNSQLHAINNQEPEDRLTVYHLNHFAKQDSLPWLFLQASSPNINFEEILLLYLLLKERKALPDYLVIGCPYRTFQLTGLRPTFQKTLLELHLSDFNLGPEVYALLQKKKQLLIQEETESNKTLQAHAEAAINSQLETFWEPYRYRGNVRARIKVLPGIAYRYLTGKNAKYLGSNQTEELNMTLLLELLRLTKADSIPLLYYQPPHPKALPFVYDSSRYSERFKLIADLAKKEKYVSFVSLKDVVPVKYWGLDNAGRLDVFHFKAEGHRLLGESLYQEIKHWIAGHGIQ